VIETSSPFLFLKCRWGLHESGAPAPPMPEINPISNSSRVYVCDHCREISSGLPVIRSNQQTVLEFVESRGVYNTERYRRPAQRVFTWSSHVNQRPRILFQKQVALRRSGRNRFRAHRAQILSRHVRARFPPHNLLFEQVRATLKDQLNRFGRLEKYTCMAADPRLRS
jgi:hypothetical protein